VGSSATSAGAPLPVPVLERNQRPAVFLKPGTWKIEGRFVWNTLPDRLPIPTDTALLTLRTEGKAIEAPAWDSSGNLWLRGESPANAPGKNFLTFQAYGLLEDGIPLRLLSEFELTVSGEPREEDLGIVVPAGWKLSSVDSPLPAVVDESGRLRVRVRAGRWSIKLTSFRFDNPRELRFASAPKFETWLLGFRANPLFRTVAITGAPAVDVSQTTFPAEWRAFPVYSWNTADALGIEERIRGMGGLARRGLDVSRQWWLAENGKTLTFRDSISGNAQTLWRIDAADGQQPGSASLNGEPLLLTKNPITGAPGVEIRNREFQLVAAGTMERTQKIDAIGWLANADSLRIRLYLPPGWRAFAIFGPDAVNGEWISAWSLLDLFLLLVFTLATYRILGPRAGVLAFLTLGLTLTETVSLAYLWLAVLAPVGILRALPHAAARPWLLVWKWTTAVLLVLFLVPFLSRQLQSALYPQLELPMESAPNLAFADEFSHVAPMADQEVAESASTPDSYSWGLKKSGPACRAVRADVQKSNLTFDANARIQTGPGVPVWRWREVGMVWNSPVAPGQVVDMILIPPALERFFSALRVLLSILLGFVLLRSGIREQTARTIVPGGTPAAAALAVCMLLPGFAPSANAQEFPSETMIETLRKRLLEAPPAFPAAADISFASLRLDGRRVIVECEIAAAVQTSVPLPLRLPAWSPVSISLDGSPATALRRAEDSLWIVVPEGVHRVQIEGFLPDTAEWEWSFALRPRRVKIDAPGWNVSGVRANGVPENQILFTKIEKGAPELTTFERQPLESLLQVRRTLEIGLVWRMSTEVVRLTPPGRAISASIPLLPGEKIVSQNIENENGVIEVRLGAGQMSFRWESELAVATAIELRAQAAFNYVERWEVVASPVWNLTFDGLSPIFEESTSTLVPVWMPWPGETVQIKVSRPEAIPGPTVTVDSVMRRVSAGLRQTTSSLEIGLRASLAGDFFIALPEGAEVVSFTHNSRPVPVRIENGRLVFALQPGAQNVQVQWREPQGIAVRTEASPVSLPIESANLLLKMEVPENRWLLWCDGPLRGPAVRLWLLLAVAFLAAVVLARLPGSPLSLVEWALLGIGLSQAPLPAALWIVAWLFLPVWRRSAGWLRLPNIMFNLGQFLIVGATVSALGILLYIVAEGLLGTPEMFIAGNGSSSRLLSWYAESSGPNLPRTSFVSISVWWYHLFMLLWALWLAAALLRWLRNGWNQFGKGGFFRTKKTAPTPTTLPPTLP
jgi:hypothetical protein